MKKSLLLEICAETLDAALAAERGGADRIELCENLREGGVTPTAELMRAVRWQVQIPIFVMIRPRAGDFCYSETEFDQMKGEIGIAKSAGMDGAVFGILKGDSTVDVQRNSELVNLARPLPVTFHRAFDETPNLLAALEDVITAGAARILTSGGKPHAEQGTSTIVKLIGASRSRIGILAGGGISAANLENILQATHAREYHSGLSTTIPYPRSDNGKFEAGVKRLAEILKQRSRDDR